MGSKSFRALGVLGLYTETSLHCGAESGTGYVDLPIQRERHTNHPVIPGSTIKGVLRDEFKGKNGVVIDAIFGSENATTPGTVSFGDGILVAFPVRSSGVPFHWVTCPLVLERVSRMLGETYPGGSPEEGKAWTKEGSEEVLLEELVVAKQPSSLFVANGCVGRLLELLPPKERGFEYTRRVFLDRLLVVTDTAFRELVDTGADVVTRIKLNVLGTTTNIPKEGKAKLEQEVGRSLTDDDLKGNMFVQELVPPETLFASPLRAAATPSLPWSDVTVIRLGGNGTIGHGVTHATWRPATSGEVG